MHLSYALPWPGFQWNPAQRGEVFEAAFLFHARLVCGVERQVAVVDRFPLAAVVLLDVAARQDPFTTQSIQAIAHVAGNCRVAPWTTGVIDATTLVRFQRAIEVARRVQGNLAKGHTHAGLFTVYVRRGSSLGEAGPVPLSLVTAALIAVSPTKLQAKTAPPGKWDGTVTSGCFSLRRC